MKIQSYNNIYRDIVSPWCTHRTSNPIASRRLRLIQAPRERRKPPSNARFREYGRSLRLVPLPVFKLCLLRAAKYRRVSLSAVLSRGIAHFVSSRVVEYRSLH
jgi:hypothetical protein